MVRMMRLPCSSRGLVPHAIVLPLLLIAGFSQVVWAQAGTNPLTIFENYFVTGDYVVSGWVKDPSTSDGTYTSGNISIPDTRQPDQTQNGVRRPCPREQISLPRTSIGRR